MFAFLVALILLAAAVGGIYLILKNMGEAGIEVAAPGSCKSGKCGVRCASGNKAQGGQAEEVAVEDDALKPKETTGHTP